jgi:hypothetical protein
VKIQYHQKYKTKEGRKGGRGEERRRKERRG